jgi:glycosyltransferase involved in cell wall biosynthesis
MLAARIGRPSFVMPRGIDVTRFSPLFRTRSDATFLIGYVGRLTAEKNVRLLARMEAALCAEGVRDYRFLIVGQGSERAWLEANLLRAEFPGVLKGDDLGLKMIYVRPSLISYC